MKVTFVVIKNNINLAFFFSQENSRGEPENIFVHIQQCVWLIEVLK